MTDFARMISDCNPDAYDGVQTALTRQDKKSLLLLQNLVAADRCGYLYLEIGSELGASLLSHLRDERCLRAISVDLRVDSQPDARGRNFDYAHITTASMIDALRAVGLGDLQLSKLNCIEADIKDVPSGAIGGPISLAFIDGEHTTKAAFRDFVKTRPMLDSDAIVVFHDANLIFDAIENVETMLDAEGIIYSSVFLPDVVYAIGFGNCAAKLAVGAREIAFDAKTFVARSRAALYREIVISAAS